MKRDTGHTGAGLVRWVLYGLLLIAVVGMLAGCAEAGLGGGDDDSTTSSGGTDSGDSGTGGDSGDSGTGGDSASQTLDTSAMVLHLGFDGDLTDETGTSSSMTLLNAGAGTAVYGTDRHDTTDGSLEIDGDYSVRIDDIDLSSAESITVTAWVRDDGSATPSYRWIAAYVSSASYYEFALRIRELASETWQDGSFETFVENDGTQGTRTVENVFPGNWVHIAMVYDHGDGELRVYQDGEAKNSTSVTLDIDAGNLIVGGGNGSNDDFHGRIDDIAVFTRALSDSEIALAKDQINTN